MSRKEGVVVWVAVESIMVGVDVTLEAMSELHN